MQTKFQEELFPCECTDMNHSLLIQYLPMANRLPECDDVLITMTVHKGDYDIDNFFKRIKWRFKMAARLLFKGYADFSTTWLPNNNSEMNLKKLSNFLKGICDDQDRRILEHAKANKCNDDLRRINDSIDSINII